jgi:branched-chain amino acid transport system substrate-binding protein
MLCALSLGTPVFAENSTQKDEIRIGVVYGFTGAAQVWSEFGRMGLQLAQDEINQAGGVHGKKIELVYEDSRTNPAQSVSAYRKLITIDNLKVVIGNVWEFITNPLIPLAERDKVILLSPTVMPESVDRTNNYFFTMGERAETIRDAVDLFFKKNQDVKRIGIFCWDDPWGQAYLRIWKEVAEKNGVNVAAAICNIDFNNDFRTDVAKIAAKKVDAVIIAHMGDVILQRMREQGFSTKVLATSNLVEDIKIKKAPKELFEGIYMTDWKPSDDFIRKFKAKFGMEPAVEAHNSYEALRSLAKALSSENTDLLSALKKVKYEGVAGAIDFSNSSFANYSVAKLYRVHDGQFELIN